MNRLSLNATPSKGKKSSLVIRDHKKPDIREDRTAIYMNLYIELTLLKIDKYRYRSMTVIRNNVMMLDIHNNPVLVSFISPHPCGRLYNMYINQPPIWKVQKLGIDLLIFSVVYNTTFYTNLLKNITLYFFLWVDLLPVSVIQNISLSTRTNVLWSNVE